MSVITSRRARSLVAQTVFVAMAAALVAGLVLTARDRLAAAGLTSGFDFLFRATGWEISFSVIRMTSGDPYWRAFLAGALNTLTLGAVALSLATVLGVAIGAMRNSRHAVLNLIAASWVNIFRNVPMMLQLLLWYKLLSVLPGPRQALDLGGMALFSNRGVYLPGLNIPAWAGLLLMVLLAAGLWAGLFVALSSRLDLPRHRRALAAGALGLAVAGAAAALVAATRLDGLPLADLPVQRGLNIAGGIRLSPEFLACVIALTIYGAAYIAEIIRAGFNAVDRGVVEAARALGISELQTFLLVRLPLALRAALPMLINQYVWLMKATTVGIAVGFADLFMVTSSSINQSGQTFEILGIFMLSFLAINYSMAFVLNLVNRAVALKGHGLRVSGGETAAVRLWPDSLAELRRIYFGTPTQAAISVVLTGVTLLLLLRIADWALVSAVWAPNASQACRAEDAGACWSVVVTRWRLILFGLFPYGEQWRSGLGLLVLLGSLALSAWPAMQRPLRLALIWLGGVAAFYLLMRGGVFGMTPVAPRDWGGLTLTVFIFCAVVALGMPLGLCMALLRRSRLALVSRVVGLFVDAVRSLPLLALIYGAAMAMPFALPDWLQGDKLWRVIVAFAFFYGAYQAEIFRAGFQSLQRGQEEAAQSLGVGYVDRVLHILLPQVFRKTLPATINQLVITFKETSLVTIIGFFDILASGAAAFGNPEWTFAYLEVYLFVGLVYYVFVTLIARYGLYLERRMVNA